MIGMPWGEYPWICCGVIGIRIAACGGMNIWVTATAVREKKDEEISAPVDTCALYIYLCHGHPTTFIEKTARKKKKEEKTAKLRKKTHTHTRTRAHLRGKRKEKKKHSGGHFPPHLCPSPG